MNRLSVRASFGIALLKSKAACAAAMAAQVAVSQTQQGRATQAFSLGGLYTGLQCYITIESFQGVSMYVNRKRSRVDVIGA